MSCNIRYFGGKDGENGWQYRKAFCAAIIKDAKNGKFPSAHYFIAADVAL